MEAIASQAGYNKSLLFQYFGDKLGLYSQVLKRSDQEMGALMERTFAPIVLRLSDECVVLQVEEFRDLLATMVRNIFDYLSDEDLASASRLADVREFLVDFVVSGMTKHLKEDET